MGDELLHVSSEDFSTQISSNWKELREESEFFDVTLACKGRMMKAHKVILSACSPVLKELIIQSQHPHPVLYLRGVKQLQLKLTLDFIYKGEVNVAKDELEDFLDVAKDLNIIGLTVTEDDKQIKQYVANKNKEPVYDRMDDDHLKSETITELNENDETQIKDEPYDCQSENVNKPLSEFKICQFCHEKVNKIGNNYKSHLEQVHGHVKVKKGKTLCCPYCFERKEDYRSLTVCRQKHKNDKFWAYPPEFRCNDKKCAGVSYSGTLIGRKSFMQHKRNHHDMEFKVIATSLPPEALTCMFCKKTFANGFSLKKHEEVRCRQNPAYNHENIKTNDAEEWEKPSLDFQQKMDSSTFKGRTFRR